MFINTFMRKARCFQYQKSLFRQLTLRFLFVFLFSNYSFLLKARCSEKQTKEFSLLTSDYGNSMYEAFGHSALRLKDSINQLDRIYSFGEFDFYSLNFYRNALFGKLTYRVDTFNFPNYLHEHELESRGLTELRLNLSPRQSEILSHQLNQCFYKKKTFNYDLFQANCSTEIRKLLESIGIVYLKESVAYTNKKSFRSVYNDALKFFLLEKLLINVSMSSAVDRIRSIEELCFYPKILEEETRKAINTANLDKPLVTSQAKYTKQSRLTPTNQNTALWLIFVLIIIILALSIYEYNQKINFHIIDGILFGLTGLFSIPILSVWLFTSFEAYQINLNLLWALPTNMLVGFLIFNKRWLKLTYCYTFLNTILIMGFLIITPIVNQVIPKEIILLLVTVAVRNLFYLVKNFQCISTSYEPINTDSDSQAMRNLQF